MEKKIAKITLAFCALCIFSCGSMPTKETVSRNLTPIEIKQLAQEEIDKGRKKIALEYYNILLDRFGSDISVRTAAEFEIAHIYIKQKKWEVAEDMLKTIITRYETAGGAGLNPKYYVLAKKDYEKTQKHFETKPKKNNKKTTSEKTN